MGLRGSRRPARTSGGGSLVPAISDLPGFAGYFLIDAGESALTSVSLFESSGQAHESTRLAAEPVREQEPPDELVLPRLS